MAIFKESFSIGVAGMEGYFYGTILGANSLLMASSFAMMELFDKLVKKDPRYQDYDLVIPAFRITSTTIPYLCFALLGFAPLKISILVKTLTIGIFEVYARAALQSETVKKNLSEKTIKNLRDCVGDVALGLSCGCMLGFNPAVTTAFFLLKTLSEKGLKPYLDACHVKINQFMTDESLIYHRILSRKIFNLYVSCVAAAIPLNLMGAIATPQLPLRVGTAAAVVLYGAYLTKEQTAEAFYAH